jgi:hypothetical protein
MTVIGIDNGLTGGLVAISSITGCIVEKRVMPIQGKSKGNEVDTAAVFTFLDQWDRTDITAILETPGKHSPGLQALCSMWDSYGAIRAVLETRGIRHHRIAPQTWQKAVLGNVQKGQTKPAALSRCRQLWPDESFLATSRSTKPHEGLVDAALIGEYGRIKML